MVWNPIHNGYHPEMFLGSWLSPCQRFIIEQDDGYYRLVANKIDYVKYLNTCNKHNNIEDAIKYCEDIIKINKLPMGMELIFQQIKAEREKQEEKWGQQNHPILDQKLVERNPQRMCEEYEIPSEGRARFLVEENDRQGTLTYFHILQEEISEVASCGNNIKELRKELIQSAAVLVAMIESLDRNGR